MAKSTKNITVDYSVTVKESSKELTPKERVMMKDTTDAIKLDEATQIEAITIRPNFYAVLAIHNSKADPVDYENYLVVDENGQKYITGSNSFWASFLDILSDMEGVTDEEWAVKIYRVPSKNYKGKDFITCSIV